MRADEVVGIVGWLETRATTYQVNGGWAVDALAGRQTRQHSDLDVFVDAVVVPELLAWLQERGYTVQYDQRPVRIELCSGDSCVDVHPMEIGSEGDGLQYGFGTDVYEHRAIDRTTGVIGGRHVTVARRERLIALRRGYELRPEDIHDLGILSALGREVGQ